MNAVSRNAARARAKDTDTRLQKSYFSKQRLAVLTKGLGKSVGAPLKSIRIGERSSAPDISLVHARRGTRTSRACLEDWEPRHVPAYTGDDTLEPAAKRLKLGASSTSSPGSGRSNESRHSRILRELDVSDREPNHSNGELSMAEVICSVIHEDGY